MSMQLPTERDTPSTRADNDFRNALFVRPDSKMDISMILNSPKQNFHQGGFPTRSSIALPPLRSISGSPGPAYYDDCCPCKDCCEPTEAQRMQEPGMHGVLPPWRQNSLPTVQNSQEHSQFGMQLPPIGTRSPEYDTAGSRNRAQMRLASIAQLLTLPSHYLSPHSSPSPEDSPQAASSLELGWNRAQQRFESLTQLLTPPVDYIALPPQDSSEPPSPGSSDAEADGPGGQACNQKYKREQVDWMRYMRVDCDHSYASMVPLFTATWPDEQKSGHCFSARLYRDNTIPKVDEHNRPMFDSKGKLLLDSAKVRDRDTPQGREKCVPFSLVDRYPWRAVRYPWVAEQHKETARLIMQGIDPTDPTGKKAKWREVLWMLEEDPEYREAF